MDSITTDPEKIVALPDERYPQLLFYASGQAEAFDMARRAYTDMGHIKAGEITKEIELLSVSQSTTPDDPARPATFYKFGLKGSLISG